MKNAIFFIITLLVSTGLFAQETNPQSLYIEENFFKYIDEADSLKFLKEVELPVSFLLSETEKAEFDSLKTMLLRKEYIKLYIRRKNENPLLTSNMWLKEFIDRCSEARYDYVEETWPYLDDRGIVFIQHGRPYRTHYEPGSFGVWQNETWCYNTEKGEMYIHFIGRSRFKRVKSLIDAFAEREPRKKEALWKKLMFQREFVGHDYAQLVEDMRNNFLRRRTWEFMMDMELKEEEAIRNTPPGMRQVFNRQNSFDLAQNIVCFRAPGNRVRMELTMLLPIKELVPVYGLKPPDSLSMQFTGLLRDHLYRNAGRGEYTSDIHLTPLREAGYDCIPGGMSFTLSPDSGDATIQIFDIKKFRKGFNQITFTTRSFEGDQLMLSDIAIYAEPPDGLPENSIPTFEIDGRKLMPYPSRSIRKENPVFCYFEIYNLGKSNLSGLFEISINIEKAGRSKGGLGGLFRKFRGGNKSQLGLKYTRSSDTPDSKELIALDLSELSNGNYTMTVTVTGPGSEHSSGSTRNVRIEK